MTKVDKRKYLDCTWRLVLQKDVLPEEEKEFNEWVGRKFNSVVHVIEFDEFPLLVIRDERRTLVSAPVKRVEWFKDHQAYFYVSNGSVVYIVRTTNLKY